MTTVLELIIHQTIFRHSEAMDSLIDNVNRDELTEEELSNIREKLGASVDVGFDIWEMLNDKTAVLEALERMENCTAYANKLISLHGEGEAKEAAKRYFEHSEGWV